MAEPDSGLAVEDELFDGGKQMIEIREEAVELERIRIPVRKQAHLNGNADKSREFTRRQPVKIHQQECHGGNHRSVEQHMPGMIHPLKQEQNQDRGQQGVDECRFLYGKQPFTGFHTLKQVQY